MAHMRFILAITMMAILFPVISCKVTGSTAHAPDTITKTSVQSTHQTDVPVPNMSESSGSTASTHSEEPEMDTTNNTPGQDGSTATMLKTANSKLTGGAAEKTTPSNVKLGTTGKLGTPTVSPCDSELLMPCDDGRGCILKKFMCDGVVDCVDASDELKCDKIKYVKTDNSNPKPFAQDLFDPDAKIQENNKNDADLSESGKNSTKKTSPGAGGTTALPHAMLVVDCNGDGYSGRETFISCTFSTNPSGSRISLFRPAGGDADKQTLFTCDTNKTSCVYYGRPNVYNINSVAHAKISMTINSFNPSRDAGQWGCTDGVHTDLCQKISVASGSDVPPSLLTKASLILQLIAVLGTLIINKD